MTWLSVNRVIDVAKRLTATASIAQASGQCKTGRYSTVCKMAAWSEAPRRCCTMTLANAEWGLQDAMGGCTLTSSTQLQLVSYPSLSRPSLTHRCKRRTQPSPIQLFTNTGCINREAVKATANLQWMQCRQGEAARDSLLPGSSGTFWGEEVVTHIRMEHLCDNRVRMLDLNDFRNFKHKDIWVIY